MSLKPIQVFRLDLPLDGETFDGLINALATHHTAGVTLDSRRQMASMAAQQIIGLASGQRPPRLVNPEVWPAFALRFERLLGRKLPPD